MKCAHPQFPHPIFWVKIITYSIKIIKIMIRNNFRSHATGQFYLNRKLVYVATVATAANNMSLVTRSLQSTVNLCQFYVNFDLLRQFAHFCTTCTCIIPFNLCKILIKFTFYYSKHAFETSDIFVWHAMYIRTTIWFPRKC